MKSSKELLGEWRTTKAKLKKKFAILTSKDLLLIEGKEEEMMDRLQIRLSKSKEEMHRIIDLL